MLDIQSFDSWIKGGKIEEVSIEGNSAGYNFQIHRAGLEPEYRKKIETELKNGNFDAISSTPTLELGIDIGALDAVITPFVSFQCAV